MYKLLQFIKRDFLVQISYRFRFFMGFGGIFLTVFMFFFVSKIFQSGISVSLARYGNDYFSFVLLGMCVSTFVSTGLQSLSQEVRGAQMQGTLEILLATPTSPNVVLFGNSLWSFASSFVLSLIYLALTVVIGKIGVSLIAIGLVLLVLFLTFICFLSLGMVSAAFILLFKQGNPVNVAFGMSSYFLGGIIFPIEVLPVPLQKLSQLLPITHAATAIREILLVPNGQGHWLATIGYLACFALVLFPCGLASLRAAVFRAKKEGSLVQF